jgi:hypothetical protein
MTRDDKLICLETKELLSERDHKACNGQVLYAMPHTKVDTERK